MKKDELSKRWAELEGWKYHQWTLDPQRNAGWLTPDHEGHVRSLDLKILPDWTEPNRFFAEVVPRLKHLGVLWEGNNHNQNYTVYLKVNGSLIIGSGHTIGEAGLEAAIKAREEIGL